MDTTKVTCFTKATKAMNKCSVCGHSRTEKTKGHGKCVEILASQESKKNVSVIIKDKEHLFSADSLMKAKYNKSVRVYAKKSLPEWMYH